MERLSTWVDRVTNGRSHRVIAEELGMGNSVVSRWVREDAFPLGQLLDFCRKYDANFLEALCVAGYATEDEVSRWTPHVSLRQASELELVQELQRRIAGRDMVADVRNMMREEVQAEVRGALATGPIDLLHPPAGRRAS
jgi:hypothetical protein